MKEDILETKLDILIADFQMHRENSVKQESLAKLETSMMWHRIIGAFTLMLIVGHLFLVGTGVN